MLELRWSLMAMGLDFLTYELYLDWFPKDSEWKAMWAPCAAQRLFFPVRLVQNPIYHKTNI